MALEISVVYISRMEGGGNLGRIATIRNAEQFVRSAVLVEAGARSQ